MRILCVGGGPGGLFFAIAAKRCDPDHRITVVERRRADSPHGWGIAVATPADHRNDLVHVIRTGDPETAAAVQAASVAWGGQQVRVQDRRPVHLGGSGYCLGRQRLTAILVQRARELGVDVRFGTEAAGPGDLVGADLVVAADGAASRLRTLSTSQFGPTETIGRNRHIWLGVRAPLRSFTYAFERTPSGWIWFYGYRHQADASTVIVECTEQTWRHLGFDGTDVDGSTRRLSAIFARHLDDHPLEARPDRGATAARWDAFRTIRNSRWQAGNVVLLGDAAHTAHFSIGSGTTLALQDGAALAAALVSCTPGDLPRRLQAYEALRRPAVGRVQEDAERSARWFEHVDRPLQLEHRDFALSLRMRRGIVDPHAEFRPPPHLQRTHRATQWWVGRTARRLVARGRNEARRRLAERTLRPPQGGAAGHRAVADRPTDT